jgi:hypothetical protein
MFARLIGIALGAALAIGATVIVNPDGRIADAVHSVVQAEPAKGSSQR